jgi:DNA-binding XRE family transcriptional regulator
MLLGYTQESLSLRTGINRASLSSWENGSYEPSAKAADIISCHLLCSPGYILFGRPSIQHGVWEPIPPKAKRYISKYKKDFSLLFKSFCIENKITNHVFINTKNGKFILLGRKNQPYAYLILLLPGADLLHKDMLFNLQGPMTT